MSAAIHDGGEGNTEATGHGTLVGLLGAARGTTSDASPGLLVEISVPGASAARLPPAGAVTGGRGQPSRPLLERDCDRP